MNFPSNTRNSNRFLVISAIAIVAILHLFTEPVSAQGTDMNPAASLEQCRNGSISSPAPCGNASNPLGWVAGASGNPQAHWNETEYIPYRMLFTGMPADGTVHTVVIGYDILHSGVHAIDYLGTYNITETTAMGNNPCFGVSGSHCSTFNPVGTSTSPIPVDPVINSAFPTPRPTMPATGVFTMWGGTLGSCAYLPYTGNGQRMISCTFTSTVDNPVLAWGGHIAWQGDWGAGNSAGNIGGNPYHMRIESLDGSGGNQDRALSANAVSIPARLIIIKDAFPISGSTSPIEFDFTADPEFGTTAFSLADNGLPGDNRQDSAAVTSLGPANPILVTEQPELGWTLLSIICTGNSTPVSTNTALRTVNVTLLEAEIVTCTFSNSQLVPSSAYASVGGRVVTSGGRGIANVVVSLTNTSSGQSFMRTTNSFGYYTFTGLPVAQFYVVSVSNKRYAFSDPSRSFILNDDEVDIDFVADPQF
jgi:hypothetical protein